MSSQTPAGAGDAAGWDVYPAGPGAAAIAPTDDSVEHDTTGGGCRCNPQVVPVTRTDGTAGRLYVHNRINDEPGAAP